MILLHLPSCNTGGAQRAFANLAAAINNYSNFQSRVVVSTSKGSFSDRFPPHVSTDYLCSRSTILSIPALLRYVINIRPKYLVSSLPSSLIACLVVVVLYRLLKRGKINLVATLHNNYDKSVFVNYSLPNKLMIRTFLFLLRFADCRIAVSHSLKQSLERKYPKLHFTHVPNVIDVSACVVGSPTDLSLIFPFKYILFVGRFVEQKAPMDAISIFNKLLDGYPCHNQLRLIMIGDGPLKSKIYDYIQTSPYSDQIHILNWQESYFSILRGSDALIITSRWEGFGNVIVEALASEVPVVSSDVDYGPRDILVNVPGCYLCKRTPDFISCFTSCLHLALTEPYDKSSLLIRSLDFSPRLLSNRFLECISRC